MRYNGRTVAYRIWARLHNRIKCTRGRVTWRDVERERLRIRAGIADGTLPDVMQHGDLLTTC